MVEILSAEQIAERRANLHAFRHTIGMGDEDALTTTLHMQEQWLATVDELQHLLGEKRAETTHLKQLAWNWLDFTPNCGDDNKCFACGEQWYPNKCPSTCPASLLFEVTKGERDASDVWLDLSDELDTTRQERDELQRDSDILHGLRTRKCLLSGSLGGSDCTEFWRDIKLYCAPCYLRVTHLTPEMLQGIREGVKDVKEGRVRPWSEVEAEIDEPSTHTPLGTPLRPVEEYHGGIPKVQEWTECNPVTCETIGQAHVWVKVGTVGLTDKSLSVMDWGDPKCLRCGIPEPEED